MGKCEQAIQMISLSCLCQLAGKRLANTECQNMAHDDGIEFCSNFLPIMYCISHITFLICRVSHTVDFAKVWVFRKMSASMSDHRAGFYRLRLTGVITTTCTGRASVQAPLGSCPPSEVDCGLNAILYFCKAIKTVLNSSQQL